MLIIEPIANVISKDSQISTVMSFLPSNAPTKISLDGKSGILQDSLAIAKSMAEREND